MMIAEKTITRQDIVDKMREFLGTPFQFQGRIKQKAVDCVGLFKLSADELFLPWSKFNAYKRQTPMTKIAEELSAYMDPVSLDDSFQVGNLLVVRHAQFPNCYHFMLWTGNGVIHADDERAGKVIETPHQKDVLRKRLVLAFAFRGVS